MKKLLKVITSLQRIIYRIFQCFCTLFNKSHIDYTLKDETNIEFKIIHFINHFIFYYSNKGNYSPRCDSI